MQAKREIAGGSLSAEVIPAGRPAARHRPGTAAEDARAVLTEVLAAFPVYRAYVHPGEPPPAAAEAAIREAVDGARRRLPRRLRGLAADLGATVLGSAPAGERRGRPGERVRRPVPADHRAGAGEGRRGHRGYRWSRLVSLNEVGCDPDRFGVTPAEFHAAAGRLAADWPATMTTLSTHDTKRQEDVRARLAVLAELPQEWGRQVRQWHEKAVTPRFYGRATAAVDPDTEYLLWQTLVGAWPISGSGCPAT